MSGRAVGFGKVKGNTCFDINAVGLVEEEKRGLRGLGALGAKELLAPSISPSSCVIIRHGDRGRGSAGANPQRPGHDVNLTLIPVKKATCRSG